LTADALLIDFGGVLTTSVFDAFGAFCVAEGIERDRIADLVRTDPVAQRLLVDVETGALPEDGFERGLAPLLGAGVAPEGLIARMTETLAPDQPMLDAMRDLRAGGVPTVLVSNSLGMAAYDGYDVDELFTHVVLSASVGVRKPSRRIYHYALELAGASPEQAVFVDDLAQNVVAAERLGLRGIRHTDAAVTIPLLADAFDVELEHP
jgi:putative hydrolase of the HAD superfamily